MILSTPFSIRLLSSISLLMLMLTDVVVEISIGVEEEVDKGVFKGLPCADCFVKMEREIEREAACDEGGGSHTHTHIDR